MSHWFSDGIARWWEARRHRGDAVRCALCGWSFARWDAGERCWRCGSLPPHRATWDVLAAHPELLREAERVIHLSPTYGLRNRIARESGFELVTAADPDHPPANISPSLLAPGSFDGAVLTEERDRDEARRLVRPGGWLVSPAGIAWEGP